MGECQSSEPYWGCSSAGEQSVPSIIVKGSRVAGGVKDLSLGVLDPHKAGGPMAL